MASADRAVGKLTLPADLESPGDAAQEPCDAGVNSHRSNGCALLESARNPALRDTESDPSASWRRCCHELCQPLASLKDKVNGLHQLGVGIIFTRIRQWQRFTAKQICFGHIPKRFRQFRSSLCKSLAGGDCPREIKHFAEANSVFPFECGFVDEHLDHSRHNAATEVFSGVLKQIISGNEPARHGFPDKRTPAQDLQAAECRPSRQSKQ